MLASREMWCWFTYKTATKKTVIF